MMLHTVDARDLLGGVSDSQMETILSAAFSSSQEAMANSNIGLSLRLVHVQPIEVCFEKGVILEDRRKHTTCDNRIPFEVH